MKTLRLLLVLVLAGMVHGQAAQFGGGQFGARVGVSDFASLTDGDTTGIINNSIWKYNSTSGKWEISTDSEGAGSAQWNDFGSFLKPIDAADLAIHLTDAAENDSLIMAIDASGNVTITTTTGNIIWVTGNTGDAAFQMPAGSVSSTEVLDGTLVAADLDANAGVNQSQHANMTDERMLGNDSGGATTPQEMTAANVLTFLGVEAGATADQTDEEIQDAAFTSTLAGTETRISVTYNDAGNVIDFVVDDMFDGDLAWSDTTAIGNVGILTLFDAITGYQPLDVNELSSIAGLTSAADRLPYYTGSGTASLAVFTATARSIIDDASTGAVLTTLGLSANGQSLVTAANFAAMRALLDLEAGTDFYAIGALPVADLVTAGIIEIATGAETNTATDATRAVSPDGLDDWTGSVQMTTLGTIITGVWNGTAVTYANLNFSNNIVAGDIATGAVTGDEILDDTIDSDDYAAASIDNEHLADNAADTDEIQDYAVTKERIGHQAISRTILYPDTVKSAGPDTLWLWDNDKATAATLDSVQAWSDVDDYDFTLVESARTGGGISTVDAIQITTNGIGMFFHTETTMTDGSIASGGRVGVVLTTDNADYVKIKPFFSW